jgi:hypothetical protein
MATKKANKKNKSLEPNTEEFRAYWKKWVEDEIKGVPHEPYKQD